MQNFRSVTAMLGSWCLVATLAGAAAADNNSIVLGESVGRVRLRTPRAAIFRAMGRPNETTRLRGGGIQDTWRLQKSPEALSGWTFISVLYSGARAIQIESNSPRFATASGVSTRSNLTQLRARFPRMSGRVYSYAERGYVRSYYDDVRRGIAFQRGGNDLMWNMKEDPRGTPESIIIHRPGYRVVPEAGGRLTTDPSDADPAVPQTQAPQDKVAYRLCSSYFESNQSGLKGGASYLVFTSRREFDKVFGAAAVMGKNSFLPDDAFRTGVVVAVIKRGAAIWSYAVEQVSADRNTLRVRYRATPGQPDGARYASPLIIAVKRRNLGSVVFIEDGNEKRVPVPAS